MKYPAKKMTVGRSGVLGVLASAAFLAGIALPQAATAAALTCEIDHAQHEDSFTLADAVSCYTGTGNLNGGTDDAFLLTHAGYVLIDKSDSSEPAKEASDGALTITPNAKSGTWSIASSLSGFTSFWIALKAADSYGVFQLAANALSGTYGLPTALRHALSHANLYGIRSPSDGGPPSETPLPAGLPLFASALAGAGLVRWRRRKTNATSLTGA